jgi:hypothetical protein
MSEEDLSGQAKSTSNTMKGLVIAQLIVQLFLKKMMNQLWQLFFTL